MNDPSSRNIQFNSSGLGCFLTFILIAALLTSVGLGWIVNGFIILILLIPVTIILGVLGFQWWLKRNIIEDDCPVCSQTFTGLNNSIARCPNCGEVVQVVDKAFQRQTPAGTVDISAVDAVEVEAKPADVRVVDVQVLEPGED
ncbi:hypothetical protein [[Limnothrix rosea] IAM M-220]|uniref:hypothetical protein n=1 Tax=[Limnothrix rosea] IAM M-220 TaxID=454133 RepID=UPI00096468F2|nr:hypothetical protein [[Limnothrix rosea] IAM M-220]OKH16009.1 hypothetical protein NIES208_12115 [[Limnothrix rosea] IAM M-220]